MDDPTRSSPPPAASPGPPASAADAGSGETAAAALVDSVTLRAPSTGDLAPAMDATQAAAPPGELVASTHEQLIGQTLAERYTLTALLGRGGMSVVFRARHELLKKQVAIKLLNEQLAGSTDSLSRFHREAMAAANIGDPHIVDVTDYGFTEQGHAFLVMELLEGQSLRQLLEGAGALPAGRAVAIARQILRALVSAHRRGIIHRDLKAENIFLTPRDGHDFVKLLDFGISKVLAPEGAANCTLTGIGVVMGTPQYIAPEQAHADRSMDHRVDIYSLGVILYEMLTGTLPFCGKSAFEVMMKHVQEAPQRLRERRPELEIPLALEVVVLKAMSKEPEQRFDSATAMLAALPDALTLPGGFSSAATLTRLPAARRSRRPYLLGAAGGVVTTVVSLTLWGIFGGSSQEDQHNAAAPALKPTAIISVSAAPPTDGGSPPDLRSASIVLEVAAVPRTASLTLGGRPLGRGEARAVIPRGEATVELVIRAAGYMTQTLPITPDRNQRVHLVLQREKPVLKKDSPTGKPARSKQLQEIRDNPYPQTQ